MPLIRMFPVLSTVLLATATLATAALASALTATATAAQVPEADAEAARDADALARIASWTDGAHLDSARVALSAWRERRAASARASHRATADVLAARLETDGIAAQHAWVGVALAHPFGSNAALALLRVGQAAVLQGDTAAARVYLTRLVDDFPGGEHAPEARLWLARGEFLAGRPASACEIARAGLAAGAAAEVQRLLRLHEERACTAVAQDRPIGRPAGDDAAAVPADARFAVQSGAFRGRAGADRLVARLRRDDFEPRLVRVAGSALMRVRVGGFADVAEARQLRERVRAAGYDAVVVSDVGDEEPVF